MDQKEKQVSVSVARKVVTLGILYFVQGLPYGFQDKFIPMYLRSSGLSHTKLSLMKLLLLPWLCKAAFAPAIDFLFFTKWFSLLCSLCALSLISFFGMLFSPESFALISGWLFMLNLFSAIQDVAVDGLALQILREKEIGHGNTAQVLGYKFGALSGGGVLFWIHLYFGWNGLCLSLFALYVLSILMFLPLYEKDGGKTDLRVWQRRLSISEVDQVGLLYQVPASNTPMPSTDNGLRQRKLSSEVDKATLEPVVKETKTDKSTGLFRTIFSTPGTISLAAFLLIYKLGERGALSIFPLFLIDQGITTKQLGFWSGVVGQTASILGSICGGWLLAQDWKLLHLLRYICIGRCLPICLEWMIVTLWAVAPYDILRDLLFLLSIVSIVILEFSAGMATTAVFSLMMSCSLKAPVSIQGTHYSVLSSVEVAGKLIFSSFIGALIDWLGLSFMYFVLLVLSYMTVFSISFLVR